MATLIADNIAIDADDSDLRRVLERHSPVATIILPAYNEAEALPAVLSSLFDVVDHTYEVLVVDDASTDDTAAVAARYPCTIVSHAVNAGKGAAVQTGLRAARGNFVIIMDADNTYPASAIPEMVAMADRFQFVRCVRTNMEHSPALNAVGNKIFDTLLKVVHGLEGEDHLSGLYGLHRSAFQALRLEALRFDLEVEIAIKSRALGLRSGYLPISYHARLGEKKLCAWKDGWQIFGRLLALRFASFTPSTSMPTAGTMFHAELELKEAI